MPSPLLKINCEIVLKYKKINEIVLSHLEIKTIQVNNKSNTSPFSSLSLLYTEFLLFNYRVGNKYVSKLVLIKC